MAPRVLCGALGDCAFSEGAFFVVGTLEGGGRTVRLMKIDEVARVLDVPVDRGYALARKGVIPVVRIGRQVRIDRDQLAAWIEGGGWELDAKAEAGE